MKLVAIDFETADRWADSACAIGIVSIEKGEITKKGYRLIRPPRRHFIFSYIHGI
jgi:DNA polymerase III subunit epsilon